AAAAAPKEKARATPAPPAKAAGELEVVKVRDNFFVLIGEEANTAVQFGPDGVLLVNTQTPGMAPKILNAMKTLTNQPLRYIVNTNMLPIYTGGNVAITKVGKFIGWRGEVPFADILAHENVLQRMSGALGSAPATDKSGWPVDTFYKGAMDLHFNGEAI